MGGREYAVLSCYLCRQYSNRDLKKVRAGMVKTWRRVFHQDRGTEGERITREIRFYK